MKIARNIALTALLASLGTAQAASPDENVNTPSYLIPYAPPAIYNPVQPVPPVMDEAQIKAQREAFEAQHKAQIETIAAQQKVFAEQMQRVFEQHEAAMEARLKAIEAAQRRIFPTRFVRADTNLVK